MIRASKSRFYQLITTPSLCVAAQKYHGQKPGVFKPGAGEGAGLGSSTSGALLYLQRKGGREPGCFGHHFGCCVGTGHCCVHPMALSRILQVIEPQNYQRIGKPPLCERFRELSLFSLSRRLRGDFIYSCKNCQGRETLKKALKLLKAAEKSRGEWQGAKAGGFG